ncbi:hypothetical protein HU200_031456 [Digitaria exilis]|uniref:VOC domain-containing protein n=1 Tax=Digitaria exilis TaxID=1010633 RepID=A0A835BYL9_9POAL|nr:hypothetical protein HU200_031456 [Digitaria exilis]
MAMGSHEEPEGSSALPLVRLNHVSFQCASVEASVDFYQRVLGFKLVKRPASLDFEGAWLHRYGMGIHLLQRGSDSESNDPPLPAARPAAINPKGNHISFQVIIGNINSTGYYYKITALVSPLLTRCAFAGAMQCTDMGLMKARLRDMKLDFVAARVRDGETVVEQLFFHDPDGNMIEICDCEKLPVIPLADAAAELPNLFGD